MNMAVKMIRDALASVRSSLAMDGGTGWEGFVDLRAHDHQYHNDNWQPGDTCKLREQMGTARENLARIGITLPNHSEFQENLRAAREIGLLDEQTEGDISSIESELQDRMNHLDSGNVSLEEVGQIAQELSTVYSAIQEAVMEREDEHAPDETGAEAGTWQAEPHGQGQADRPQQESELEPDLTSIESRMTYRPKVPEELRSANDAVMTGGPVRFARITNPSADDYYSARHQDGYNCFLNDLAGMLTMFGYKVRAPGEGYGHNSENIEHFKDVKKALLAGGAEIVNVHAPEGHRFAPNQEEQIRKLDELALTMPNGSWLSIWDGAHNSSAFLHNGKWYALDMFYGEEPVLTDSVSLAADIPTVESCVRAAKHEDFEGTRKMSEDEIIRSGAGMTYVINPQTFRITPELVKWMQSRT